MDVRGTKQGRLRRLLSALGWRKRRRWREGGSRQILKEGTTGFDNMEATVDPDG
jgi:hypothetical protein